ncbi:hypothetical protein D9M71_305110 [compost metagenome]
MGQGFQVVDDQRRIHQHLTVIQHQGGRLDHRVDLLELFEVAEHRNRLMFQRDSQAFGRNGGAPDIGRVQHTDQLHGPFLYMAISGGTTLAEVRSPANDRE